MTLKAVWLPRVAALCAIQVLLSSPAAQSPPSAEPAGVVVSAVTPGRPAESAGPKPGDIITSWTTALGTVQVKTPFEFLSLDNDDYPAELRFTMALIRDGRSLE